EYFRALEIPLLRGRGFFDTDREKAPKVAIVSDGAARLLRLGADPIGQRIRMAGDTSTGAWRTVVGLAGDIRFRSLREATPTIYLPARQYFSQGLFAVRTVVAPPGARSVGAAVGLAAARVSSRLLTALLSQGSSTDPITLAAVCMLLVGVGWGAAYVPARRAMAVDPMVALRYE